MRWDGDGADVGDDVDDDLDDARDDDDNDSDDLPFRITCKNLRKNKI